MKPLSFVRFAELCGLNLRPGQRVHDAVAYDGVDPCDLPAPDGERARVIFGAVQRVPVAARPVSVQVKGRDVGGTRRAALRCLQLGLTLALDSLDPSELAYVFFGAPKLRLSHVAKRFALEGARRIAESGDITIDNDTADGFTVVRHDGRRVRFECFAASRGGDNVRGVPIIAALLDEASFFLDEQTGVVNDRAIFNAIVPRLLAGGQILIVSSPWGLQGLLAEEFAANHGNPTAALAAHCPTLIMRDEPDVREMVERAYARSSENGRRELGAEFLTDHAATWPAADCNAMLADHPGLFSWGAPFFVADPAESLDQFVLFGAQWGEPAPQRPMKMRSIGGMAAFPERDEWGRPIFEPAAQRPLLRIFDLAAWSGPEVRRLGMEQVTSEIAGKMQAANSQLLLSDQRGAPYLAALVARHGIRLRSFTMTASLKHESATLIRTFLRDRQISLANDSPHAARFVQEAISYRRTTLPGGGFRYSGGTRSAVDDWPAALVTLGAALLEERGTPTDQQHFTIEGAPSIRPLGGRTVVGGR